MSSLTGSMGPTGSIAQGNRTGTEKIPSGYSKGSIANFSPEQIQLFQQMFGHVSPDSYTSRLAGGDEQAFNEMEAPAMRDFQGLQGQISSRFSGLGGQGSLGSRRSSGFQNQITAAGSNFAQDLQARRHELQRNAIKDLMGMSSDLLGQRPYDNFLVEKRQKQNPWADIAGKFAGAIPGAVAGYLTGGGSGAAQGINSDLSTFTGGSGNFSQAVSGPYNLPTFMGR